MRLQGLLSRRSSPRTGADILEGERAGTRTLRLLLAFLLVNGLLLAPTWIYYGGVGPLWLSLEAGVLVGVFALLPPTRWARYAAAGATLLVLLFAIVGLGDTAMRLSLSRHLNIYIDFWLLRSVWHLLRGTLGMAQAVAIAVFAPAALVGLGTLVTYLLLPGPSAPGRLATRLGAVGVGFFLVAGLSAERVRSLEYHVDTPAARLLVEQSIAVTYALGERERFVDALAMIPDSYSDTPGLFSRLEGSDVILGFIESYGMAALTDPRYRPILAPRLNEFEVAMAEAGLHLATGTLIAPTQGGQSWFSHGSLLSGIWLDNQVRYDMLLSSDRETLIDDFQRGGHRAVVINPAIVLPWPEGERLGYDEVLVRKDIDYAGPTLNWVEMPDQFTWSFVQSLRDRHEEPLFAEIGLISSHAPWTPILEMVDWDEIGDGSIFRRWEGAGEAPEQLWLDTERVREHYARSVEYAVHAAASYAERYVDEETLFIVLGDHQPAPLITGDDAPWSVPVHVVSGDPRLVQPFLDWGFKEGAWPDGRVEPLGMDYFRDWFVGAFSGR